MKAFHKMSDDQISEELTELARKERELIGEILCFLREVEKRKIHLKKGYSSLFAYLVKELGYPESTAYQRISALKVMRESRDRNLIRTIESGKISLNAVSEARKMFDLKEIQTGQRLSPEDKRSFLKTIEGKGRKERELEIQKVLGSDAKPPREIRQKNLQGDQRLHMTIGRELQEKLERCRELMAHKLKTQETSELIELLAEEYLRKKDPLRKETSKCRTPASSMKLNSKKPAANSRYIPRAVREEVHRRAKGCCQYRDPKTGRACGSKYKIQVDHIIPFSRKGPSTLENLQLLCASHNGLKGAQVQIR